MDFIPDAIRYTFWIYAKIAISRGFGGGDATVDIFLTTQDMNKRFKVGQLHQKRGPQLQGFFEIIISRKISNFWILIIFFKQKSHFYNFFE